jgi:act minimal PKS acyl carrier protein
MTVDDIRRILTDCAGEDETMGLRGEILDVAFADLGYDSLALLEMAARIDQEFGVSIPDEQIVGLHTPRAVLDVVGQALTTV